MRETITRRRAEIEAELRAHLPDVAEFQRYREGPVSIGRPRTSGQVFLATFDGLTPGSRAHDRVIPVAVALELASMQCHAHRTAFERARSTSGDDDPTRDILRGDLFESTAFEAMLSVREPPRVVTRCFEVLARTSRQVQEGHAMRYGDGDPARHADRDVVRHLGALTGGAVELAALLADADLDDDARRRLADRGSAFGFHVWAHSLSDESTAATRPVSSSLEACHRALDALVERAPADARERLDRQLRAFLAETTSYEFIGSTA